MRICYLGPFDPFYTRNRVLIRGLRQNNVEVVECNSRSVNRLVDYLKLLIIQKTINFDVIILGARGVYYGQPLVPLVKRLTNRPVVFDAMLTLYETYITDRKIAPPGSIKAKFLYLLDYNALHSSDLVFADTYSHAQYYSQFYGVTPKKFRRLLVGSDDTVFYPRQNKTDNAYFRVIFWGGFIPLQGVKYIIKAAKLLQNYKDIKFELRGSGQTYDESLKLAKYLNTKNLTFFPNKLSYNELPDYVAKADICLGIFGGTRKANHVIPNKAIEAIAMQKPLITGISSAINEIFTDKENCLLVPMADPKAIAEAILNLKQDKKLRDNIAKNSYNLYCRRFSPKIIGKEYKSFLIELLKSK